MDKSRTILREGYLYREEKLRGQAEVLYCVLKPNTLSFHRRKVHKRHTPLGLLKLDELIIDIQDFTNDECVEGDSVDCNHNLSRFPWNIMCGEHKVFLYCASLEDRTAWIDAIVGAKKSLTSELNTEDERGTKNDNGSITERANEQGELTSEVKGSVDNHQLLGRKCVYNSSDTTGESNDAVRTGIDICPPARKSVIRVRSRSLSEVEKTNDDLILDSEQHTRYLKSKSAPPDNGKRGCKTVDKLIDVHSGLCRQLVRWI
jgi:hypothetical protein